MRYLCLSYLCMVVCMVMSKASNKNTGIIFERKFENRFPLHFNTYAYVMTYARHDISLNMLEQTLSYLPEAEVVKGRFRNM